MDRARSFASGNWHVKEGREEEFIGRWLEFLRWTRSNAPGLLSASLIRESEEPRHFVSFARWDEAASRDAWRTLEGFPDKLGACRELCDDFEGGNFEQVASVP
jgi:heme-degrading monooxygenase HmoA